MRIALLFSVTFHAAAIGVMALITFGALDWEHSVAAGRPLVLRVSVAAEEASVSPILETLETVREPVPTPDPVDPQNKLVEKQVVDIAIPPTPTTREPEIAAQAPPPPRSASQEMPPTREPAPAVKLPRKTSPLQHTFTVETSVALASENADLGAKVDELPSKLPTNLAPEYPPDALLRGIEGRVLLRVKIGASGAVESVALERSSGVESFDNSAQRAVKAWRFTPARRSGVAVAYEVLVPVRFSIRR